MIIPKDDVLLDDQISTLKFQDEIGRFLTFDSWLLARSSNTGAYAGGGGGGLNLPPPFGIFLCVYFGGSPPPP